MNEKKTVKIEVPAPPDGYEVFFNADGSMTECSHVYMWGEWRNATGKSERPLLARKRQSLADWMNANPDLATVARMLPNRFDVCVVYSEWSLIRCDGEKVWPKPPMDGQATTQSGRWIDR